MINIETIYLHITKRCNLQCLYCYFQAGEPMPDELTTNQINNIFSDLPSLNPRRIIFTGGEPLLRKDIFDLAKTIKNIDEKIVLGITTNGILINQQNAKNLVQLFDEIRISIDGPKEINDVLRGKFSYEKAMQSFGYILAIDGNPSAFITVTAVNVTHLKDFMKFLLSNGVCKIHISPLKNIGRATNKNLLCNLEETKSIIEEFWYEQFGFKMISEGLKSFNCGVGKYISIHPDGSVYPCHVFAFPEFCIGNVKNESLSSIFHNSLLLNTLRNLRFDEIAQCAACFSGLSTQNSCLGMYVQEEGNRNQLNDFLNSKKE